MFVSREYGYGETTSEHVVGGWWSLEDLISGLCGCYDVRLVTGCEDVGFVFRLSYRMDCFWT